MASSTIEGILRQREMKNERTVAIMRSLLSLTSIWTVLSYLQLVPPFSEVPSLPTTINMLFFISYSTIILLVVFRKRYRKYLKFFIILLDYTYVGTSFVLDSALSRETSTTVWIIFTGALVFFMINLLRYSRASILFSAAMAYGLYFSVCLYHKVYIPSMIQVCIPMTLIMLIGYLITVFNLRMIVEVSAKKMLERYLPPQLVGSMSKKDAILEPGGINRKATVLFTDIRSFTGFSEYMKPKVVVTLLNDYLSRMTEIIFEKEGTIDKFIGDAIMTVFGTPVSRKDDAMRAILTAIEMQQALKKISDRHQELREPLTIGAGIHTGDVIVGNIGSEKRMDYTAIGDNVNLTSRLEGLTKYYECQILISGATKTEITHSMNQASFILREIDKVVVKGRTSGVEIHEVMPFATQAEKEELEKKKQTYETALSRYRNLDFSGANKKFLTIENDRPAALFAERCRNLINNPPPDSWDGIYQMKEK